MSSGCCACSSQGSLIEQFPDKRQQLESCLDGLPLTADTQANRGHLIQSLHKAQEIFGYLSEDVQILIATRLGLHLSEVYGVISFYSYFTIKPLGRHRVQVCTGTACFVRGADQILDEFKRQLQIEVGQTTDDGNFSLGGLRCVGACSLAPVVMVNERVYGNVTTKMVSEIISECQK
ncbi:MAG: NAD(P)H-dependent oxidoreductase subunit E [Planctomycetes bacterium]|nr:NAD(P)H-dependent oxidoreductase subunit E [Planctomycetota bacterium]